MSSSANWARWRIRFLCPRCRRSVSREFEVRMLDSSAAGIEQYEQAHPSALGPIEMDEAATLLQDPVKALQELASQVSSDEWR